MTNAEMAKQIKEFNERLDRYYENQEETINKYDDKIVHLHNELEELAERVNGIPEKAWTLESMYPCLWKCEHRGKECNGQAQACPIAEHFSKEHGGGSWKNGVWTDPDGNEWAWGDSKSTEDEAKTIAPVRFDNAVEKMARPILFSKFNAGKMAIVFNGNDPLFEAAYIDFCRAFDEWCSTRKTEDKLIPQSEWPSQIHRMDPFMKCPSIYKDRSSFAIWTEHSEEGANHTFEYGTLMTDWREHCTVDGLPYTVWRA